MSGLDRNHNGYRGALHRSRATGAPTPPISRRRRLSVATFRRMVEEGHWVRWHTRYEDPESSISRRLAVVKRLLSDALLARPPGPIQLVSICAGQGRDVIEVLANHSRSKDVRALLVELDPDLVIDARRRAHDAGVRGLEVRHADASMTSAYREAVPADVILACGVFGNISDGDVARTISELRRLSATQATVIWTRHRREPDLTPTIRAWFSDAGFEELAFESQAGTAFGVGANRLTTPPEPFRPHQAMFTFVGDGTAAHF